MTRHLTKLHLVLAGLLLLAVLPLTAESGAPAPAPAEAAGAEAEATAAETPATAAESAKSESDRETPLFAPSWATEATPETPAGFGPSGECNPLPGCSCKGPCSNTQYGGYPVSGGCLTC